MTDTQAQFDKPSVKIFQVCSCLWSGYYLKSSLLVSSGCSIDTQKCECRSVDWLAGLTPGWINGRLHEGGGVGGGGWSRWRAMVPLHFSWGKSSECRISAVNCPQNSTNIKTSHNSSILKRKKKKRKKRKKRGLLLGNAVYKMWDKSKKKWWWKFHWTVLQFNVQSSHCYSLLLQGCWAAALIIHVILGQVCVCRRLGSTLQHCEPKTFPAGFGSLWRGGI